MASSKKLSKDILKKLTFEPAPLSTDKGRRICDPISRRITKKDRKHSGHRIIYCEDEEGYVTQFDAYDDWEDYRDSQRDNSKVIKNIYPAQFGNSKWWNNTELDEEDYLWHKKERDKIRKEQKIRRAMKDAKKV